MKKSGLLLLCVFFLCTCFSQKAEKIEGVYKYEKDGFTQLWIFTDGYTAQTTYQSDAYVKTRGGAYTLDKGQLKIEIEFDDKNPSEIGSEETLALRFKKGKNFEDNKGRVWVKQDKNAQDLDGAWQITGRQEDGELTAIHQTGSRKTIKLLKDGYFQWLAIDPGEKKFFGTGGGQYIFKDGTYTENIVFFSRDNNRVGASLNFTGELKEGKWHHSGKSSAGDPIYEIWEKVE